MNPCGELETFTRKFGDKHGDDNSLCVFLRTHLCVCKRIAKSQEPSLLALNAGFAAKCVAMGEKYEAGEFHGISERWVNAFYALDFQPKARVAALLRLATAHILDDLPELLCDYPVSKADYDRVLDEILACLAETQTFSKTFLSELFAHLNSVILPGAELSLHLLRDYAWKQHEKRKKLRESGRKRS